MKKTSRGGKGKRTEKKRPSLQLDGELGPMLLEGLPKPERQFTSKGER